MTNKEYRECEGVSRSTLAVLLDKTPLHLKYQLDQGGREDTKAFTFGRAAHKYILEKDDFFNEFAVSPKFNLRTKVGKADAEDFAIINAGKDIIAEDDFEQIKLMRQAIDTHPVARELLTGEVEQSFFWTDEKTGEKCKVRPDVITTHEGRKYLVDYKTTDSCEDGHFERSVRRFHYDFQAAMYCEGLFNNTLEDYGFCFVAQEKKPPYAVRVYFCSEALIYGGMDKFKWALDIWHYCRKSGDWFGYKDAELAGGDE